MGVRPAHCYREFKRAYTRKSKYKKKGFIKAIPPINIAKFDMGDLKKDFKCKINLVSRQKMQIRHNALESARQMIVRRLDKMNRPYRLKLRTYPHHALRENKMLTGAGADRMQTGMQQAFGKVIGTAARINDGQAVFTVFVDMTDKDTAIAALKSAVPRLPCRCTINVSKNA